MNLGEEVWVPERRDPHIFTKYLGRVYYCAGLTADYLQRPADTVDAHVSLLTRVLQQSDYESLVYLSSTRVYDGNSYISGANENSSFTISPLVPRHLYDLTKLTGESLCISLGKGKAKVARLSCVYNDHTDSEGFLPRLLASIANIQRGDTLNVQSSANSSRDYVHISDVVKALVNINLRGSNLVYNVASGSAVANTEIKELIEKNSGRYMDFLVDKTDTISGEIDINRMKNEFDWKPKSVQEQLGPWLRSLV